jgi:hypothetical protein
MRCGRKVTAKTPRAPRIAKKRIFDRIYRIDGIRLVDPHPVNRVDPV